MCLLSIFLHFHFGEEHEVETKKDLLIQTSDSSAVIQPNQFPIHPPWSA